MCDRGNRKSFSGVVFSSKMQSTVVVVVERLLRHPKLGKVIRRRKKVYAHTDIELKAGDKVVICETRPMSKMKRWRVVSSLGQ